MKLLYVIACMLVSAEMMAQAGNKFNDTTLLQPVEMNAVRAAENAPFAKTNIGKKEIEKNNLGQDLPFLLNQSPSVIVNSDAGTGIGYTGIRIRGTDASRINVTLNGIPYNDAESQGTFFVDLPDFASSIGSIQIQRGIGTSTNGAGSFGGTINFSSNEIKKNFYAAINNSIGSFGAVKNNFLFGSGLLGGHFTLDARLSKISSDGYIDRASADLKSFYASAAYISNKNSIRLNIFSGKEKTYQAWYGVPENLLQSNRTYNPAGMEQPNKPYENENDHYVQTHYQLFLNHQFNSWWKLNIAGFLTKGNGYYEQYKANQSLPAYQLPEFWDGNQIITHTDLVRRLCLDNSFYGTVFSFQHQKNNNQFIIGGGWNQYDGNHFGIVHWAQVSAAIPTNHRWYDLTATKKDFSLYTKWTQEWNAHWLSFVDLQFRAVDYHLNGFRDNPTIQAGKKYGFMNPKIGITYTHKNWMAYASYALAAHEPNRDDFEANPNEQPKAEILNDIEVGIELKNKPYTANLNFYYMKYKDQLILTGRINDVGAYTRTNIPNSYRIGIEFQNRWKPIKWFNVVANASLSSNKINQFTEYLDDYDNGGQQQKYYASTHIAFSPSIIASGSINFIPLTNGELSLIGKYVGRQYLDNTAQASRSLQAFYTQDLRLSYSIDKKIFNNTQFILQVNNIFNRKYEPNGYSFSYIYNQQLTTENYFFPMAGRHFMAAINVKL